ncbi:Bro-N domain-containing protein [Xylella fastidiosa subsp. multiplex]|uniref:Bro-N domain-containing protein n=1 Tax=Xylella fastidiosa subsp. multiplex TaxID=644357 RepID=A0AAW6HQN3_XYLFS|nr:Bro-N domain-containing protein [Xylella fastidiosa]MDC6407299.1 Bro-N domain-containing protein [Xylella fastidiosa subsp. multiplex]MDD0936963.1 Bro-N domain-containing protein [Xylella fastidiosa subsp. multiplex]
MTRSIIPFDFHSHTVRVVMRDGNPWFIATDVAVALGYRDAANAARHVGAHQKGTHIVSTIKGNQELTIVSEGGLYRLVLRSRKPEAVAFSDWVTDEVLPSIRKTGSYVNNDSVSLTTAHRCGTVAGKERNNSGHSGTRIRKSCGFFTPARFYVGRAAAIQHPVKGKAARRLCPVVNLPTPTGAARNNVSPWSSHDIGDVL